MGDGPQTDTLYSSYGRDLYKTGVEDDPTTQMISSLNSDQSSDNSSQLEVAAETFGSGVDSSTTEQGVGQYSSGKTKFDNTEVGYILGVDKGTAKFYIGNTTSYLNWDGATLTVKGSISATAIDIPDTVTANSFHVDSSGNAWWGATTLAASTANVTAAGVGTFAGLSVLNKKTYTCFETAGRFVSTAGGTGTNSFGNQGVTIAPGATGSSYSILQWKIGNVLTNNPTFTCTIVALGLVAASGSSRCYIGLGQPTVSGSGISYANNSHVGITINKDSGTVNVGSEMNDGSASSNVGANFTTISDNDVLEIFIKMTAASVKWYYRKNGGALTLGDTQTTHIPSAAGEDSVTFNTSNAGTAFNCQLIMQCAAYEH